MGHGQLLAASSLFVGGGGGEEPPRPHEKSMWTSSILISIARCKPISRGRAARVLVYAAAVRRWLRLMRFAVCGVCCARMTNA
jgi:hypothetical protein